MINVNNWAHVLDLPRKEQYPVIQQAVEELCRGLDENDPIATSELVARLVKRAPQNREIARNLHRRIVAMAPHSLKHLCRPGFEGVIIWLPYKAPGPTPTELHVQALRDLAGRLFAGCDQSDLDAIQKVLDTGKALYNV